jgi:hypothetical protein
MNIRATQVNYDFADCTNTKKKSVLIDYRKSPKTDRAILKLAGNNGAVRYGTFTDRWRTYQVILFNAVKSTRLFLSVLSALTDSNDPGKFTTASV